MEIVNPPVIASAVTPSTLTNPDTGVIGTSLAYARAEHEHVIPTPATPVTQAFGDVAASGAGVKFAADLHKHGMPFNPLANYGRLAADAVFTSNTTLAALTNLGAAIGANEKHTYTWDIFGISNPGAVKFDVTGPAAPTNVTITLVGIDSSGTEFKVARVTAFSSVLDLSTFTGGTSWSIRICAEVENGANAGTVQLRAAQSGSSASATTINAGSWMTDLRNA